MNCPRCGKMIDAGMRFCSGCGFAVSESVMPQMKSIEEKPVRKRIMQLMGSPIFIIACLCTILSFCITVVSWFMPDYLSYILMNNLGFQIPYINGNVLKIFKIFENIPLLLKVIGIIILLCKVKSEKKSGGLTLIKVGLIIDLVSFAILATIICIALTVTLFAGLNSYSDEATVILIFAVVAIIAILFFCFLYLKGLIEAVNVAKRAVVDNVCTKKPSMYVVVINFIIVLFNAFIVFVYLTGVSMLGSDELVMLVLCLTMPTILDLVALFLYSILMIKGRGLYEISLRSKELERKVAAASRVDSVAPASAPALIGTMAPASATSPAPAYAPTPAHPEQRINNNVGDSHLKTAGDL